MSLNLPAPNRSCPDLLIIAGEHSGDEHAVRFIKNHLLETPKLNICAFGGQNLKLAGADLIIDMTQFSVLGIVDVLKKYFFFKNLLNQTFRWIQENQPKSILFVDYPGFNLRLAERLYKAKLAHKAGGPIKLDYYISPQIWAWKSRRRFKMEKWLDSLFVIFPFEVECYVDTKLPVKFVGHPFVSPDYVLPVQYSANQTLLLLPGSRKSPIKKILPTMLETFGLLLKKNHNLKAAIIYPNADIQFLFEKILNEYPALKPQITLIPISSTQPTQAQAVLASSGTMSLNCALAGIPGAITYKAHTITYFIGRLVVDIDRLGIANILLKRFMYPEFIQQDAIPQAIADNLQECLVSDFRRKACFQDAKELKEKLVSF